MQLHQFSDTVQDLCHEGHSLAQVHFNIDNVPYVLKSIDVTSGTVIFRLQAEPQRAVHEGFLALGRADGEVDNPVGEKSSKSIEKT